MAEHTSSAEVAKRETHWHEPRELTDDEKKAFLDYVEAHRGEDDFSVRAAAEAAGVRRADIKLMRKQDENFDEDYRNARGYGTEAVMNAMVRLGINGVDEPIVSAGKLVTDEQGKPLYKRVYDSRAAIELFKALTPDGKAALAGKLGIEISGTIDHNHQLEPVATFEGVARLLAAAGKELPVLEAPEGTAEVISERDEPA